METSCTWHFRVPSLPWQPQACTEAPLYLLVLFLLGLQHFASLFQKLLFLSQSLRPPAKLCLFIQKLRLKAPKLLLRVHRLLVIQRLLKKKKKGVCENNAQPTYLLIIHYNSLFNSDLCINHRDGRVFTTYACSSHWNFHLYYTHLILSHTDRYILHYQHHKRLV